MKDYGLVKKIISVCMVVALTISMLPSFAIADEKGSVKETDKDLKKKSITEMVKEETSKQAESVKQEKTDQEESVKKEETEKNSDSEKGKAEKSDENDSEDITEKNSDNKSDQNEDGVKEGENQGKAENVDIEITEQENSEEGEKGEKTEESNTEKSDADDTENSDEDKSVAKELDTEESDANDLDSENLDDEKGTFYKLYDDVSVKGLDFSSKELLIGTFDTDIFTEDTEVVSEYRGVYLTRYPDEETTKSAYTYYFTRALFVDVNSKVRADGPDEDKEAEEVAEEEKADGSDEDIKTQEIVEENAENHSENEKADKSDEKKNADEKSENKNVDENSEEKKADMSDINKGEDAISILSSADISDYSGENVIALIDTGATGDGIVKSVSVIGQSVDDDNGHGTAMAKAILSAAPEAKILSIKALGSDARGNVSDIYAAIEYAMEANVSVINLSMSSIVSADNDVLYTAVKQAQAKGIKVVASAGNNGKKAAYYVPGNISGVYTIGACDEEKVRRNSSNYGSAVDYYVVADTTSVAAAKFSGYIISRGLENIREVEDVYKREEVSEELSTGENNTEISGEENGETEETGTKDSKTEDAQGKESENGKEELNASEDASIGDASAGDANKSEEDSGEHIHYPAGVRDMAQMILEANATPPTGYPKQVKVGYTIANVGYAPDHASWTLNSWSIVDSGFKKTDFEHKKGSYIYCNGEAGKHYPSGASGEAKLTYNKSLSSSEWICYSAFGVKAVDSSDFQTVQIYFYLQKKIQEYSYIAIHKEMDVGNDLANIWFQIFADKKCTKSLGYLKTSSAGNAVNVRDFNDNTVTNKGKEGALALEPDTKVYLKELGVKTTVNGKTVFVAPSVSNNGAVSTACDELEDSDSDLKTPSGVSTEGGRGYLMKVSAATQETKPSEGQGATYKNIVNSSTKHVYWAVQKVHKETGEPVAGATIKLVNLIPEMRMKADSIGIDDKGRNIYPKSVEINGRSYRVDQSTGVYIVSPYREFLGYLDQKNYSETDIPASAINEFLNGYNIKYDDRIPDAPTGGSHIDYEGYVSTVKTDSNGFICEELTLSGWSANPRSLYVYEYTAPDGYIINPNGFRVNIHNGKLPRDGEKIDYQAIEAYDTLYETSRPRYFAVQKTDRNTGEGINGVTFRAVGENLDTSVVTTTVNGKAGVALFKVDDLPEGDEFTYTITETAAPARYWNYTPDGTTFPNRNKTLKIGLSTGGNENTDSGKCVSSCYTVDNETSVGVKLVKSSSDTSVSESNPNYSLKGAVYKLFKEKIEAENALRTGNYNEAVMTFETGADGKTGVQDITGLMKRAKDKTLIDTTFYAVEAKTAEKGYLRSEEITSVTVTSKNDISSPAEIKVSDKPVLSTMKLKVIKKDAVSKNSSPEGSSLEGAKFELSFYACDVSDVHSVEDLRKNFAGNKIEKFSKELITEKMDDGTFGASVDLDALPIGFITLEETEAPAGYKKDDFKAYIEVGDGTIDISENMVFIVDPVVNDKATEVIDDGIFYPAHFGERIKVDAANFAVTVEDKPIRGDIELTKVVRSGGTEEPLQNVRFRIKNLENGEIHYIFTGEDGYATTKPGLRDNALNYYDNVADFDGTYSRIWFDGTMDAGNPEPEDRTGLGALSKGRYEIKEMRCAANRGKQLERAAQFEIKEDGEIIKVFDSDASEHDGKVHNVPSPDMYSMAKVVQTSTPEEDSHTLAGEGGEVDYKNQTIEDTVYYSNLRASSEYTFYTELMVVDSDGNAEPYMRKTEEGETPYRVVSWLETPKEYSKSIYEASGKHDIRLEGIDPTVITGNGKKLVVYETLYYGRLSEEDFPFDDKNASQYPEYDADDEMDFFPLKHHEPQDEFQTIRASEIHTTLTDDETQDHVGKVSKETQLTDAVMYSGLTVGKSYTVSGTLQICRDGKWSVLTDEDGKEISSSTTFVAEKQDGIVNVIFEFDSSLLRGETVVAFEELKYNGVKIAVHADLEDEDQTVRYPEFKTTSKNTGIKETIENSDGSEKEVEAGEGSSFTDIIHFRNLLAERKYLAKGVLMDKNTGEEMMDASGRTISSSAYFETPKADRDGNRCDGDAEVIFENYDLSELAGKTGVIYEEMYLVNDDGTEVYIGEHKDIKDVDQFVTFIEVHTNAGDEQTGINISPEDSETVIEDKVTYKNVIPGKEYTLTATIHVTEDGSGKYKDGDILMDKNGAPVTYSMKFIPENTEGEIIVPIKIDTSGLKNVNLVVFEDMYNSYGIKVAAHNDLKDKKQSIRLAGGYSSASDMTTKDQVARVGGLVDLTDKVYYKNLQPGVEYELTGTLYSQKTESPIKAGDKTITSSLKFTPEKSSGDVDVTFKINTNYLQGASLVVYEEMYYRNKDGEKILVFSHKDINEEKQTLYIPKIKTTATAEGKKEIAAKKKLKIKDKVSFENLIPGKEYKLSGVLMNKKTGKKLKKRGSEIVAEKTFKSEKANGNIELEFEFDASGIDGDIVVYEELYHGGKKVAEHKDINDKDQTVTIRRPASASASHPKTGDIALYFLILLMTVSAAASAAVVKRKWEL